MANQLQEANMLPIDASNTNAIMTVKMGRQKEEAVDVVDIVTVM
jgi:hypothetical protein